MVAKHDNSYPFFILRSLDLEAGIKATTRLKFKSKSLIHGFGNCSFLPLLTQILESKDIFTVRHPTKVVTYTW